MITRPRFLCIEERLYLMSATYQAGQIVELSGPYQVVGDPGVGAMELMTAMSRLMLEAQHEHRVLKLEDLPEKIRKQVETAINRPQG